MNASIPSDDPSSRSGSERQETPRPAPKTRDKHIAASAARFAEFLHSAVPTALIPPELHAFVHREANARLDAAREAGVPLEQVTIGEDGLPAWPGGPTWDPDAESLHAHLQSRLIDWDAARELGDLVRGDIVSKGRLKLAQAREMGIALRDVFIGRNLLPEWTLGQVITAVDDYDYATQGTDTQDESDMESATMGSRHSSGATALTPLTDVFDTQSSDTAAPNNSPVSSCESDYPSDWEDYIELDNFVLPQPEYEEPEDDHNDGNDGNVVHDVQVVGGRPGTSDEFDLEVYLVDDDSEDIAHMPEVELFIDDGDAYEHHYGADKAVDVELPAGYHFVPAGVEEADDEDEDEANSSSPSRLARAQPLPLFDDEDIYDDSRVASPVLGVIEEDSSEHSEEVTDDENDEDSGEGKNCEGKNEGNGNGEGDPGVGGESQDMHSAQDSSDEEGSEA
ncbi:hypothetical protein ACCO45_009415 [Purpureocillium lilacinum]|uniref:Uncharacterized protein n=1 Tax=Purpureocillium lilacinum TaxID=33203 RepID=A0ACC4DJS2_PURLI